MADRFDLDAIEADDALLDLLAAGGESARTAGEHDPAVALLADLRLAVEVEDELPVETIDDPESFLARCAALNPMTDPFARKVATRGLAFGVAAVAALSVSGVAAAVTGDPLSPYEKVIEKMVDAVRPQTSFPKEDLDGLPVVDRSKIVKVGKDFKDKAKAEHAAQTAKDGSTGEDDPQSQEIKGTPDVLQSEGKPVVVRDWPYPLLPTEEQKTQEPVKPTTEVTATPEEPTGTKTDEPTGTKTDEPTGTETQNPPDTPTSTPTEEPTEPTTPTPTETTTTTPPPTNGEAGTGDTGTSTGDSTTGDPTVTPSAGAGDGQTGGEQTTDSGSDSTTKPGGETSTGTSETSGDDSEPSSPVTQVPDQVQQQVQQQVEQLVENLTEVLPTPTGLPVSNESAEQFFGDETAKSATTHKPAKSGKHSSGKVNTGSVRKTYARGKHSSGQYPEGKHAAIARTHGSTTDASLLQILDVVNKPIR